MGSAKPTEGPAGEWSVDGGALEPADGDRSEGEGSERRSRGCASHGLHARLY